VTYGPLRPADPPTGHGRQRDPAVRGLEGGAPARSSRWDIGLQPVKQQIVASRGRRVVVP